jgi:hypothetical protein
MFVAHDKLHRQNLKQAIVVVPQGSRKASEPTDGELRR